MGFTVVVVVEAIERFAFLVQKCFYKELSIETKSLVKLFSCTFSRSNYDRPIDLTLYQLRSNYESALTRACGKSDRCFYCIICTCSTAATVISLRFELTIFLLVLHSTVAFGCLFVCYFTLGFLSLSWGVQRGKPPLAHSQFEAQRRRRRKLCSEYNIFL